MKIEVTPESFIKKDRNNICYFAINYYDLSTELRQWIDVIINKRTISEEEWKKNQEAFNEFAEEQRKKISETRLQKLSDKMPSKNKQ